MDAETSSTCCPPITVDAVLSLPCVVGRGKLHRRPLRRRHIVQCIHQHPLRSAVPRPSFLARLQGHDEKVAVEQKNPEGIVSHGTAHVPTYASQKGSSSGTQLQVCTALARECLFLCLLSLHGHFLNAGLAPWLLFS